MYERTDDVDPLERLIAAHPDLDAHELADAWTAMDEHDDEASRPRTYEEGERRAHEIVLAHLQHTGTQDVGGTVAGELSDRSRDVLADMVGLGVVVHDQQESPRAEPVCVLPWRVFRELLADFTGLAAAHSGQDAKEWMLRRMQRRLADDAARKAWEIHRSDQDRTD